jgi:hypothetical protein
MRLLQNCIKPCHIKFSNNKNLVSNNFVTHTTHLVCLDFG